MAVKPSANNPPNDPIADMTVWSTSPQATALPSGAPESEALQPTKLQFLVPPAVARSLRQEFDELSGKKISEADGPFHPVLIFGTSNAGKSNMLASLLTLALKNVEFKINHSLFELKYNGHPASNDVKAWTREFYYKYLPAFLTNVKVEPTRRDYPFFVPIKATFNGERTARIAFLESQGEWLNVPGDGFTYNPLRPEIVEILEGYLKPISVIFVLPASATNEHGAEDVRRSHQAIAFGAGLDKR